MSRGSYVAAGSTTSPSGASNHRTEHHLFPGMPPQLRRACPIVRRYCKDLDIPYIETGLIASYRQALTSLHEAGAPIRDARRSPIVV